MCTVNFLPRLPSLWLYLACSGSPSGYSCESAGQCRCPDSRAKAHFDSVVGGSRFAVAGAVAENIEAPVDSMQLLRDGRVLHDPQQLVLLVALVLEAQSRVREDKATSHPTASAAGLVEAHKVHARWAVVLLSDSLDTPTLLSAPLLQSL